MKKRVVSVLLAVCMCFQMLPAAFADDSITSTVSEQSQEQQVTADDVESLPSPTSLVEGDEQATLESEGEGNIPSTSVPTGIQENLESADSASTLLSDSTAATEMEEPLTTETPAPSDLPKAEVEDVPNTEQITTFAAPEDAATIVGSGNCGENLTWTEYDDGKLIIAGYGKMSNYDRFVRAPWSNDITSVVIEDGVTEIGQNAFAGRSALTDVTIPDSVVTINNNSFESCTSLEEINLPAQLTTIGTGAFASCSALKSIIIPSQITVIDQATFRYCESLESVVIPESVKKIDEFAFNGCSSLVDIKLPEGIDSITNNAFNACRSLVEIEIPQSVTSIGINAFYNCEKLETIEIPESVSKIGPSAFQNCKSLTSITIPEGIVTIDVLTFAGCTNLENITLPETVTKIYRGAFRECPNLSTIYIPNRVEIIDEGTFISCTGLTNITLPDGVSYIDSYTFQNCTHLESIVIPESVTVIGESAFEYCDNLTDVYFTGTEEEWNEVIINSRNEPLKKAVIHYGYNPAELELAHITSISPESGSTNVSPVQWNNTNKKINDWMILDIYFDAPIKVNLNSGKIRIRNYDTGEIYREIYQSGTEEYGDAVVQVDESDPRHMEITLMSATSSTWRAGKESPYFCKAIPYDTELYVEIEKGAVEFLDSTTEFSGIKNRDVWHFKTIWGLNPDRDYLAFVNGDDTGNTDEEKRYGFENEDRYRLSNELSLRLAFEMRPMSAAITWFASIRKTWGGACLGMTSVMGLSPTKSLDLKAWDENANCCYDLAYPKESVEAYGVKDLIHYYQLLQWLPYYPQNRVLSVSGGLDDTAMDEMLELARGITSTKQPMIINLSFNYEVFGKGTCKMIHSLLCFGFMENDSEYVLPVYDPSYPNIPSSIYIDKGSKTAYLYGAYNSKEETKRVTVNDLYYVKLQDLSVYNIDSQSPRLAKSKMLQGVSQQSQDNTTLYVDVNSDFVLTNAKGQTLEYHGNAFEGTMEVHSTSIAGSGTAAQYILKVDPSDTFVFQIASENSCFAVEQGTDYMGIRAQQADILVTVRPGVDTKLESSGVLNYTLLASVKDVEGEFVALEGETQDTVSLQYQDNGKIHLNADDLEEVEVKKIQDLIPTEEQVDTEETDGSIVVGEKIPVREITAEETDCSLVPGQKKILMASIYPATATNKNILWSSSNTDVVSVDNQGAVVGLQKGSALITAQTEDGGYTVSWNITVEERTLTPVVIVPTTNQNQLQQDYMGGALDLSGLFTIDINAGAATYTLLDGGTGAGTLTENGNLTVTKAGTFVIQVNTAATDTHAAGSAQVTLTVNKGKGKGTLQVTGSTYPAGVQPAVQDNLSSGSVTYYYNTVDSNQGGSLWTTDTVLDAGEYWMYAEIAATELYEAYTTSAVPFTVQQAVVDQLNLANLITAPVRGATPQTELSTSQFTGTILWNDTPTVFAPETVYTATVKLTAVPNYTLEGLKADSFQYAGAEVHYDPTANQVTIVFPATDGRQVQSFAATGTPSKTTYDLGEAFDVTGLTLTVTYDDGTTETVTSGYRVEPATMAADTTQVVLSYGGVKAEPVTGLTVRENLVSIQAPQAITGLANGTEKTAEALGLPKTVKITTSRTQRAIAEADVTWDLDACSYDPAVESEQTFVVQGLVSLPQGMTNLQNVPLTVAVQVTVKASESKPTEPENPGDTEEKPGTSNQPAGGNETPAPTASANAQPASDDTTKEEQNQTVAVPQTGDPMPITVLVVLMAVSFAGILALSIKRKKDR